MLTTITTPSLSLIQPLKKQFEEFLKRNISKLGSKSALRDACEYALINGGKRIRPLIVLMTAEALGNHLDVFEATLSVEYFHTASLIADDLPCMDNDDFRREKPSAHKIFGEATALLASYALISAGYEKILSSVQVLSRQKEPYCQVANEACVIALDHATRCAGLSGATGGQYLDLYPEEASLESVRGVIYKKTVTLFEVSFIFGWLFGGGDIKSLPAVQDLANHFGMAFQVADDLNDIQKDKGKNPLNSALFLGEEKARALFDLEIEQFCSKMKELELFTPKFEQLTDFLIHQLKAS